MNSLTVLVHTVWHSYKQFNLVGEDNSLLGTRLLACLAQAKTTMWDPPPGYDPIDLTGQSPVRMREPSISTVRVPAPPLARSPQELSPARPGRDQRKMKPLRPSDSGMTAVLAIRQHAAVMELSAHRHHHSHHHSHHHQQTLDAHDGEVHSPIPSPNAPKQHPKTSDANDDDQRTRLRSVSYGPEGELHSSLADSNIAHSAKMQYLPARAEVPAGVIVLRGSGARIMFSGAREGQDIEAVLNWYKPKKINEARGKIVVMRRDVAGQEYQEIINMRRQLMSAGALAMVVVQTGDDSPIIDLPEGDMSEPSALPVLYVKALHQSSTSKLEREAKDGVKAMIMFDAVTGAEQYVAEALTKYTPHLVVLEADDVKLAFNEHDVPYVLPEVHRKVAQTLNKALHERMADLNGALASLQQAMKNAQENFSASFEEVEQRMRISDGRVLYLEHVIKDMQEGRIARLNVQIQQEKQHSRDLEEQLYKPEVQAVLQRQKRKPREASVASFFDSGRMIQPGQEPMPMPLSQAADILGHTKPGDLADQADFLVGQAAEMAGSEDADVIRIQSKLRLKENNKWFNQWYNILSWRSMQKVIREGTLPLLLPTDNKTLRSPRTRQALPSLVQSPDVRPESGVRPTRLSTANSGDISDWAPSTPDSTAALQSKLSTIEKASQETVRSFIAEVKALEEECAHWRSTVDQLRHDLRGARKDLTDEKMAHEESRIQAAHELMVQKAVAEQTARDRDASMCPTLQSISTEIEGSITELQTELKKIQELQERAARKQRRSNYSSRNSARPSTGGSGAVVVQDADRRRMARSTPKNDKGLSKTEQKDHKAPLLTREESEEIFKAIDANGNGQISQIEYIKALRKDELLARRLGLPSQIKQEEDSRNIFQLTYGELDRDGSKTISLDEFIAYYTKPRTPSVSESRPVLAIEDGELK
jgi:hypothetical protein